MKRPAIAALALLAPVPVSGYAQYPSWVTSRAEHLAPPPPALEWQLSLGDYGREYVNELVMVGAGHVLVGITDGPYVMLDATTGDVLWTHGRDKPSEGYRFVSPEPVVLVEQRK